jgi:DNA-binding NarL/FixJ family response regulator
MSAINLVLAGGVYIPHELMYSNQIKTPEPQKEYTEPLKTLEKLSEKSSKDKVKGLTERQIDIVKCIAEGLSNKQIAYKLNLTEGTVKVHITVILKVLNVKNRTSAVLEAAKRGYIPNNILNKE